MSSLLKTLHPIARKPHSCMFCRCTIPVGEKYHRSTLVEDGELYDWITHEDCVKISSLMDMYSKADDGLNEETFLDLLYDYADKRYRDPEIDDLPEDIRRLSAVELVRKIIADWDTPESILIRKEEDLFRCKYFNRTGRISQLEAEIVELKKQIKKS